MNKRADRKSDLLKRLKKKSRDQFAKWLGEGDFQRGDARLRSALGGDYFDPEHVFEILLISVEFRDHLPSWDRLFERYQTQPASYERMLSTINSRLDTTLRNIETLKRLAPQHTSEDEE